MSDRTDKEGLLAPPRQKPELDVVPGYHLWRRLTSSERLLFVADLDVPAAATALQDCAAREIGRRLRTRDGVLWVVLPAGTPVDAFRTAVLDQLLPHQRAAAEAQGPELFEMLVDPGMKALLSRATGERGVTLLDGASGSRPLDHARFDDERLAKERIDAARAAGTARVTWVSFWSAQAWHALSAVRRRALVELHHVHLRSDRWDGWYEATPDEMVTDKVIPIRGWPSGVLRLQRVAALGGSRVPDGRMSRPPAAAQELAQEASSDTSLTELIERIREDPPSEALSPTLFETREGPIDVRRWQRGPSASAVLVEGRFEVRGSNGALTDRSETPDCRSLVVDVRTQPAWIHLWIEGLGEMVLWINQGGEVAWGRVPSQPLDPVDSTESGAPHVA